MFAFIKEPLVHFLLGGLPLFAAYDLVSGEGASEDPTSITVDRAKLVTYMQYRAKTFDAARFNEALGGMPEDKLQSLIDSYVKEEALYREAKALGLDSNDYVARQRLIQQLTYITRGFIDASTQLTEADLTQYLQEHTERYREQAKITFTHVYFSFDRHGRDAALKLAEQQKDTLNSKQVPFHKALSYGDRFLYHSNYVGKEADLVGSHFNEAMKDQLFSLTPDDSMWQGPYMSPYGAHVVMVTSKSDSYSPPLSEIRGRVAQDALQDLGQRELDLALDDIVTAYDVRMDTQLHARLQAEQ